MKAFYSILYFQSNSFANEKIAGGLLLFSPQKIWFEYLPLKLDIMSKLSGELVKEHLKQTLKGVAKFVDGFNLSLVQNTAIHQQTIFEKPEPFFNELYLSYLSKYSQGLLQYSEPQPIAAPADSKLFNALFEKFIGAKKKVQTIDKYNFHHQFQLKINKPSIKDKVDINLKLYPQKFQGIYSETKVSLIGKNGVITAMQDIDFNIHMESLGQQLNQWDVLVDALGKFSTKKDWKKGDYSLVFNKPKSKSPQEKLLNEIHKSIDKPFKMVEMGGVEELLNKVEQNDYLPFSKLIE